MIVAIYLIIYTFYFVLSFKKFTTLIKPNILFNTMWCLGPILVSIGYAGLYKLSNLTHFYIIVSLLLFNSVYLIFAKKNPSYKDVIYESTLVVRWKLIYFGNIISYIIMVPIFIKAIKIINDFGWNTLRMYAFIESELLVTDLQIKIIAWVVYPIFLSTILLGVIFAVKRKRCILLYILSILNLIIYTISFGGRYDIVKVIMYFLFSFLVIKSVSQIKIKISKRYVFVGIIIIMLMAYLTTLRSLKGLNFIQNSIVYFFGSLTFFDILIHSPKYQFTNSINLYGRGVLGFIINPVLYIVQLLFKTNNYTSEYWIKIVTNNYEYISDNFRYNAMPSSLYVFWRDGRIKGIIVGMILFSMFVVIIERLYFKYNNLRYFSLYILTLFIVFSSVMTYDLLTIRTGLNMLCLWIFTGKQEYEGEIDFYEKD